MDEQFLTRVGVVYIGVYCNVSSPSLPDIQACSVLSPELIKYGFLSLTNLLEKQLAVFNANRALGQSV